MSSDKLVGSIFNDDGKRVARYVPSAPGGIVAGTGDNPIPPIDLTVRKPDISRRKVTLQCIACEAEFKENPQLRAQGLEQAFYAGWWFDPSAMDWVYCPTCMKKVSSVIHNALVI